MPYIIGSADTRPLLFLPMEEPVFVQATGIYRRLRNKGITICETNDCIIAARPGARLRTAA